MEKEVVKWKVIDREYIIKRPWLTARRDKVELPDGRIIEEYYVLEYPDWVNVIAITKDGQFVMEKQFALSRFKGLLALLHHSARQFGTIDA